MKKMEKEPTISLRGGRTHNLKNIDLDIPRYKLVVVTGLSGSGKSSLVFDTLYAEGQRRYVESLSAYARQFLQIMDKPDVDLIEGLSPAIAIEQKATNHNPRSTVGTVTEILDYLRLLFARAGVPYCPEHHLPLVAQTVSEMVDTILALPPESKIMVLAPIVRHRKGKFTELVSDMQTRGYIRFQVDQQVYEVQDLPELDEDSYHDIDVVVDRLRVRSEMRQRLAESLEQALQLAHDRVLVLDDSGASQLFSARFACPLCDYTLPELEPRLFSFNSPAGACPNCDGLGVTERFDPARVVAFPSLSLASGAIKGWDKRNGFYFSMLEALAKHYHFDVNTPYEDLPKAIQQLVLYGSGEELIEFVYHTQGKSDRVIAKKHPFEGIIHNFERRFHETDSEAVRGDLEQYRVLLPCAQCHGTRLRKEAQSVYLVDTQGNEHNLPSLTAMTLHDVQHYFDHLQLAGAKAQIADKIVREVKARLRFLVDVGLSYLSLARGAQTLSGGESQRIRLASQIGSGLTGVMYVLDEPSIGLHQRDNDRLIETLYRLRDLGNSVLVVEHDEDAIRAADYVVDIGPGAGVHGGEIIAQGTPEEIMENPASLTGKYLNGSLKIAIPPKRTPWLQEKGRKYTADVAGMSIQIKGACGNNLKDVHAVFPVGLKTCVTGVSGSGKSTLVNDTLYAAAARILHRAQTEVAPCEEIEGLEFFDKVINVDQAPIGRTPRSNPATYTGLFTPIRELFAQVPAARERGYDAGRFSFNVKGGRCEACQGDGMIKVEMHFLPDMYVPCDICHGQRYNRETLEIDYKGKSIADVLAMTVEEAHGFFEAVPAIARKLQTLLEVGLGYITLGQSATTLSGGEAQRIKLALELSKRDTGKTLYILDEPTTGLHFADIEMLLKVIQRLRDAGNTIVIIEHNLDVIKTADWIIDMGPEGGDGGGTIIATGTPESIAQEVNSHTGHYLRKLLT